LVEKLHPIVPNRGKHWQAEGKMGSVTTDACCAEATENAVSEVVAHGGKPVPKERQRCGNSFINMLIII